MALTITEEAQLRALIAQQTSLLSLASSEATIISKLAATKVSLADLSAASSASATDLLLTRQGTTEKSITAQKLKDFATLGLPTTIASTAESKAGTNNTNVLTPLRMREGFNASGTAPVYACRAWVNFNGTGTVYIRASGNVSSITDNGIGDYTINFITALSDGNGACIATTFNSDGTSVNSPYGLAALISGSSARYRTWQSQSVNIAVDFDTNQLSVFR